LNNVLSGDIASLNENFELDVVGGGLHKDFLDESSDEQESVYDESDEENTDDEANWQSESDVSDADSDDDGADDADDD
jgi:hypothetical protein